MLDGDGLQRAETVQRRETLLAPMARTLHATEGQLHPTTRTVVVDVDLAGFHTMRQAQGSPEIACPDASELAVFSAVRDA